MLHDPAQDGVVPDEESLGEHRKWRVLGSDGVDLCTRCWCKVLDLSAKKLGRWKKCVVEGLLEPPAPAIALGTAFRASPQEEHADAWLAWAYENLAENRAEVIIPSDVSTTLSFCDEVLPEKEPDEMVVQDPGLELAHGVDQGTNLPVKFLPPGRLVELWESQLLSQVPELLHVCISLKALITYQTT